MEDANKKLVGHEPCPACGSKDNLGRYADGHAYCFGCGHKEPPTGYTRRGDPMTTQVVKLLDGQPVALTKRGISKETCEAFGYMVGKDEQGNILQIANHFDDNGEVVAQKTRSADKEFRIRGNKDKMGLYGQHLWKPGGKTLWIPEGEIDTLTLYEVTKGRQAVVGLPNGAQNAVKDIRKNLEFVESFDKVYLMFDSDEPGRKAQAEVAQLLSPGKVRLVRLPLKDPNECLLQGKTQELLEAIEQAKPFQPDGVVSMRAMREKILKPKAMSPIQYPWEGLNEKLRGIRDGELIVVTAGIGTGKTTWTTQLAHHLVTAYGDTVGMMMMEDAEEDTPLRLIGHTLRKPIHVERGDVTDEEILEVFDTMADNVFLYENKGEPDEESFLSKVNFYIQGLGCKRLVIDNLSVIVAGLDERDERRAIDRLMKKLFSLAQRTGATIFLVAHLKRIDGNKGHEDGQATSLSHLRGGQSIGSNANAVIGLERNQQSDTEQNLVTVRVLKNRYTGQCGIACQLEYNHSTGRLEAPTEVKPEVDFNDHF